MFRFSFIFATLAFCTGCIDFTLPEPSMEKELIVGDFLFVDSLKGKLDTNNTYYIESKSPKQGKAFQEFLDKENDLKNGIVRRNDIVVFNVSTSNKDSVENDSVVILKKK